MSEFFGVLQNIDFSDNIRTNYRERGKKMSGTCAKYLPPEARLNYLGKNGPVIVKVLKSINKSKYFGFSKIDDLSEVGIWRLTVAQHSKNYVLEILYTETYNFGQPGLLIKLRNTSVPSLRNYIAQMYFSAGEEITYLKLQEALSNFLDKNLM